jgi:hypothetical protein
VRVNRSFASSAALRTCLTTVCSVCAIIGSIFPAFLFISFPFNCGYPARR